MKKANKFPYKRVRIYWVDIVSCSEWMTLDKAKDQVYSWCEDLGYLLYKDQKKLVIFASYSFDDDGTLRCSVKKLIAALYELSAEFNCELKGEFYTYGRYDAHHYKAPKFIKEELID